MSTTVRSGQHKGAVLLIYLVLILFVVPLCVHLLFLWDGGLEYMRSFCTWIVESISVWQIPSAYLLIN